MKAKYAHTKMLFIISVSLLLSGCIFETDKQCYADITKKTDLEKSDIEGIMDTIKADTVSQDVFESSSSQNTFKTIKAAHESFYRHQNRYIELWNSTLNFKKMMEINDYDRACNYMFDGFRIVKK